MTALVWDAAGERKFETGVDRGVLYVHGDPVEAVVWNGLSSIQEILSREVKSYYTDGIRYLNHQVLGAYSATLQAYTYPDELDDLTGVQPYEAGVFLHDQRAKAFSLSYRTGIGNDLETEAGYKLHVIYNLTATPSSRTYNSLAGSTNLAAFEWNLQGIPPQILGVRPTSHISLDSMSVDADLLSDIEDLLYGTVSTDPDLPTLVDLLAMVDAAYA